MKKFNLIILFFALFLSACTENPIEIEDNSSQNIEINSRSIESTLIELEVDGNEYISKFQQLVGTDFKINRMYEYSDDIEMHYIYAVGYNSTENSLISRYSRARGVGETCTGFECAKCEFPPSGGCACSKPSHPFDARCDHTITKDR